MSTHMSIKISILILACFLFAQCNKEDDKSKITDRYQLSNGCLPSLANIVYEDWYGEIVESTTIYTYDFDENHLNCISGKCYVYEDGRPIISEGNSNSHREFNFNEENRITLITNFLDGEAVDVTDIEYSNNQVSKIFYDSGYHIELEYYENSNNIEILYYFTDGILTSKKFHEYDNFSNVFLNVNMPFIGASNSYRSIITDNNLISVKSVKLSHPLDTFQNRYKYEYNDYGYPEKQVHFGFSNDTMSVLSYTYLNCE